MNRFRLFDSRYRQIVIVIIALMAVLAIRLFVVTVIQHDKWSDEASEQNTKTIYTSAPRGNIYDRNGKALAVNRQVFTVVFNASSLNTQQINQSSLNLINTLIDNGDKYTDNFPIKIDDGENFYYTYDQKTAQWLEKQGFDAGLTAEQAFKRLRAKYDIDPALDRYDAMDVLQDKYKLDPPISVKSMKYTYRIELESFLGKFGFTEKEIGKGISAKDCFAALRKDYKVDAALSDSEARKIFIIRNEIATNGYTKYIPIKVAKDVSSKTIAYIEESAILGAEISSETERVYPNNNTACHILGYMGAIAESDTKYYVEEKGYNASDLIGKDGIESSYEEELHGTPGTKKIRVNSSGEYVETISDTESQKGSDVYLTVDLNLQKVAESSLAKAISKSENSKSGAAVAIDVETGDVLALASYPTYNPNIFAGGISSAAWESVQQENPRDMLSPAPLYNNATRTAVAPGSTFKPITALAALQCGLNPDSNIYDKGYIDYGGRTYGCSSWNDYGGNHGSEDLEWGIGNSCNYFFFCIATGKDWGTGASLGYKEEITVDKILNVAKQFGLGDETGIEIGESVLPVASAETKLEQYRTSVRLSLYNNAHTYFPEEVANDYDKLNENMTTIADWIYENPSYETIMKRLEKDTDVKKDQIEDVAAMVKFDNFIQAQWNTGDQFNISIGQGNNAYTPVQMANYLATLGNNGVRNQVSVVSGVEGEGMTKKADPVDLGISQDNIKAVVKGMKRVTTSGTLGGSFSSLGVDVAGKTGTAENQGIKQPASEVDYIKEHLDSINSASGTSVSWSQVAATMADMMESAPDRYPTEDDTVDEALIKASNYKVKQDAINSAKGKYDYYAWTISMAPADNPKIAVAVLLVEGGYSSNAAPVVKDIIGEYLNIYGTSATKNVDVNGSNKAQ